MPMNNDTNLILDGIHREIIATNELLQEISKKLDQNTDRVALGLEEVAGHVASLADDLRDAPRYRRMRTRDTPTAPRNCTGRESRCWPTAWPFVA